MNKRFSLFLLGGISALIIAIGIGRFSYTPILPLMQQNNTSFSNSLAGFLASSNYAGYLVGSILVVIIPMKHCKITVLKLSLIASILTTAFMGIFNLYSLWFAFRFISGVVSAFLFILSSGIVLEELTKQNKVKLSGIFYSGPGIGIFLTGILIPIFNTLFNWEVIWILLSIISIPLAIISWIYLKETPKTEDNLNTIKISVKVPPAKWLPWIFIAYGLEGLGYIVTGTFIIDIAEKIPSFNGHATIIWAIVGLFAIPSCLIWSSLGKKYGLVKSLIFAMILQAMGIAFPVFFKTELGIVVSAILFGATFIGITALGTTLVSYMKPNDNSKIIGAFTAIYGVGQMVGPSLAGMLSSSTNNYYLSLLLASIVVFIGGCLLFSGVKHERLPDLT